MRDLRISQQWWERFGSSEWCQATLRNIPEDLNIHGNCNNRYPTVTWTFLMVCWPCIVIYSYNENQQDALFAFNLFQLTSTFFEQGHCSSSGYYSVYTTIGMCHAFMLTGCWQDRDGIDSIPTFSCFGLYTTVYIFRVYLIFWCLYFGLFQVKVQLVSKWMIDYNDICFWSVDFDIGMKLDLVVRSCRLFSW